MIRPIVADLHTHTVSSGHAFSTISENAAAAAALGLRAIAFTEHAPALCGAPIYIFFETLKVLPRYMNGVLIIRGAEVNVMDFNGTLDLEERIMEQLEWVIASFHQPILDPCSVAEGTRGWMGVAHNPYVDVIGHCCAGRYPFEHKTVIQEFAKMGKIVELNNKSFQERPGADINCPKIAELCAEYGVPVILSSDAHYCGDIGKVDAVSEMLKQIRFPEELIINTDYDRVLSVVLKNCSEETIEEIRKNG